VKLSTPRRLAIGSEFSGRFWQSCFYEVATDPTRTERRDWFGSTTGLGGRRKFGGALIEGW
jgi:hypothetical protein